MADLNEDIMLACFDLVGRAGAREFEIGWDCPHAPGAPDDHSCEATTWHAIAKYQGVRVTEERHRSPSSATLALAERLLKGATCRCRRPVSLSDRTEGCRWRLVGPRWRPGCDVPSVRVEGAQPGDLAAMHAAMARPMNRAERRAAKKRGRRG